MELFESGQENSSLLDLQILHQGESTSKPNQTNFSTPEVHLAQYHLVQKDHLAQHFFEQNFITLKYT